MRSFNKGGRYFLCFRLLLFIMFGSLGISALANGSFDGRFGKELDQLRLYYFAAARTGNEDVVKGFIDSGFSVDAKNPMGFTALMISAYRGHISTVKMLLALGADPCAEDNKGNIALMGAVIQGEYEIAKLLLYPKCDPNHQNNFGKTALMHAHMNGHEDIQRLLVENGADASLKDYSGHSLNDQND